MVSTALRMAFSDFGASKPPGRRPPLMKRIQAAWRASTVAIVPAAPSDARPAKMFVDLAEVGLDAGVLEDLRRSRRTSPCR